MTTFNTIRPAATGEHIDEGEIRAAADALRRNFSGDGELSDEEHFAAQALLAALVRVFTENPRNVMNVFQIAISDNLKHVPPRPAPAPHWVYARGHGHLAA